MLLIYLDRYYECLEVKIRRYALHYDSLSILRSQPHGSMSTFAET